MERDIDFSVDEPDIEASVTREMPQPTGDASETEETAEMLSADVDEDTSSIVSASTVETPTIEQQFAMDATGELPSLTEEEFAVPEADSTAEINLDDLGLDIGDLGDASAATDIVDDDHLGDLDDTAESQTAENR